MAVSRVPPQCCNHPDMFEGRPIVSAYDMEGIVQQLPSLVVRSLDALRALRSSLEAHGMTPIEDFGLATWAAQEVQVQTDRRDSAREVQVQTDRHSQESAAGACRPDNGPARVNGAPWWCSCLGPGWCFPLRQCSGFVPPVSKVQAGRCTRGRQPTVW
jgi:hypothetical protein